MLYEIPKKVLIIMISPLRNMILKLFYLGLMICFGLMTNYMLRTNINIAIVKMINNTDSLRDNTTTTGRTTENVLNWSPTDKSNVLGAFFYGYFVMQASIEFICHKFSISGSCTVFKIKAYWLEV